MLALSRIEVAFWPWNYIVLVTISSAERIAEQLLIRQRLCHVYGRIRDPKHADTGELWAKLSTLSDLNVGK